ncbi:unnamed protein product, partial [Rotaria sordida]
QQHLEKALAFTTIIAKDFTNAPTAVSIGACYNGHLVIVIYLIEQGDDYFIENQAKETPIMNAKLHQNIQEFFCD